MSESDQAQISRRHLLALGGAAVAATVIPAVPAAPVAAATAARIPRSTWIVGTPGESDHYVIRAATREAAIRFRAEECEMDPEDDDFVADGPCECCQCTANAGYEATRVALWDGKPEDKITDGDWIAAGFEATCRRCSYETSRDAGGHSVDGVAVCEDCMTLADWEIADPERAAELRADLASAALAQGGHHEA